MTDTDVQTLNHETDAWRARAADAVEHPPASWQECTRLVRRGIALRRRWDRIDPFAPQRAPLLETLAALETVCQQELTGCVPEQGTPPPELVERVLQELEEDDRYLVDLLDDHDLPVETAAFAVECLRDDLHWLGTQIAILDGAQGIDFLGRILLEQEALQREIDVWEDHLAISGGRRKAGSNADGPSPAGAAAPRGSREQVEPIPEQLRQAAEELRVTALSRRAEALLTQPTPTDPSGWHRQWRAASHVSMQVRPASGTRHAPAARADRPDAPLDRQLTERLDAYRVRAAAGWADSLHALPLDGRRQAIQNTAADLCDLSSESLTFLEDLPLDRAVAGLEVLSDDLARCRQSVADHWSRDLRGAWRSLGRQRRRVEEELQERRIGWRMESIFGHRAVVLWERFILLLLVLFLGMLAVEITMVEELSPHDTEVELTVVVLAWADLGICVVFLTDFLLRLYLAQRRGLYFWHNWITGLVPSIPFGFISLYAVHVTKMAEAGEGFVFLRALRYLRLPRIARYLRLARPIVRMFRLVGFTLRASDRLMRQLGPLVNRNLVLFEQAAFDAGQPRYRHRIAELRERFNYRAAEVFTALSDQSQWRLLEARIGDLTAMLRCPRFSLIAPASAEEARAGREIPLDRVIARLLVATPAGISDGIGRRLARSVARWCRAMDVFAVRRLPLVRDFVAAGHLASPYETTARVANRIGRFLKGWMDRLYWVADLYGTVTAPQLVDSLGDYMVRGTARPARRLITVGVAFLAAWYLASLMPFDTLTVLTLKLRRLIGTPLVVLGLLCLIPLFLGLWFRRIAGEATDFYSRVAEAQFLTATKQLKTRLARHQHAVFEHRVMDPEHNLNGRRDAACLQSDTETDEARTAVELLWRDYLDGPPFHRSDTKTTTQLLGNVSLVALRHMCPGHGRRQRKQLDRLDLANARTTLRGPYLWFLFITRSLAQQTAKLVVDYNGHALPVCRFGTADDRVVARYVHWLARRLGTSVGQLELPAALAARINKQQLGDDEATDLPHRLPRDAFQGNDFTAIHFLSNDRMLEEEVGRRYGDQVASLMRADRRNNVRRVFQTFPLHRLPKETRTVNPMTLYERHLSGGRVLFFPCKLLYWSMRLFLMGIGLVWRFVREVLDPTMGEAEGLPAPDPYAVALRKIHRMRGPVFLECLRMRAQFDPEYLGVFPPGMAAAGRARTAPPVEEDLAGVGADPVEYEDLRHLAAERRLQILHFRRWLARFDLVDLSARSMRAATIAYVVDYCGLRSTLEATAELRRAFDEVVAEPDPVHRWSLWAAVCRLRFGRVLPRLFQQPEFRDLDADQQHNCLRRIYHRRGTLLAAARLLSASADDDPVDRARRDLAAVARDPATWTRQLIVLRAVQTLSVLDLETYCRLVAELGEYDDSTYSAPDGMVTPGS